MILIIHGNDIASSRNLYFEEKNKVKNPCLLNGDGLTFDLLFQTLENKSLFQDKIVLLIENFFTKNKANTLEFKKIIAYINESKNLEIIFWESSEVSKANLALLKESTAQNFSFPQSLFIFLDNLKPKNAQTSIKYFHDLKTNMEIELIFFMIVRQFRLLISQLNPSGKQIEEAKRMAPWQLSKFKKQASYFEKNYLLSIYQKLFKIDFSHKTGKLPYSLEKSIDFFLIDL